MVADEDMQKIFEMRILIRNDTVKLLSIIQEIRYSVHSEIIRFIGYHQRQHNRGELPGNGENIYLLISNREDGGGVGGRCAHSQHVISFQRILNIHFYYNSPYNHYQMITLKKYLAFSSKYFCPYLMSNVVFYTNQ